MGRVRAAASAGNSGAMARFTGARLAYQARTTWREGAWGRAA